MVGQKLLDRNLANSKNWAIVTAQKNENNKEVYGTGWTYLKKGTNIKDMFVIDFPVVFKDNDIIILEENTSNYLDVNSTVYTTDGLVLNLDPRISFISYGR